MDVTPSKVCVPVVPKIEISYVGYNKTAFTGISLELGNTLSLNAEMKPSAELLDEVVVVADAKANAGLHTTSLHRKSRTLRLSTVTCTTS